jgi:hypothetical protein
MRLVAAVFIVLFVSTNLLANPQPYTILVKPDGTGMAPNIQAAVIMAGDWDIIGLTSGVYSGPGNVNVDFMGKKITIWSLAFNPDSCIIDCQGWARGFIFHTGEDQLSVLEGVTVMNGYAPGTNPPLDFGGAVSSYYSGPTIRNCKFVNNTTSGGSEGGALFMWESTAIVENCYFESNTAGTGGAVRCDNNSDVSFTQCTFLGNPGSAVHSWFSDVEMTNCTFSGNTGGQGGGFSAQFGNVSLWSCRFLDNSGGDGGAVWLSDVNNASLTQCEFSGNMSGGYGGAVFGFLLGVSTVDRCTFWNNSAANGGAIFIYDSSLSLTGSTLSHNSATGAGGGMYCGFESIAPHAVNVDNTIIAFSTQGEGVKYQKLGPLGDITLSCSDIFGNAGGDWIDSLAVHEGVNGNISRDPYFCDPLAGDLHVTTSSPCVAFSPPDESCDQIGAWPAGCVAGVVVTPPYVVTNCSENDSFSVFYDTTGTSGLPDNIRGYDVVFEIDPAVAVVTDVIEKEFLKRSGLTLFDHEDHGDGTHTVTCVLLGGGGGVTGTDSLFLVRISPVAEGLKIVSLTNVMVRDADNQPILVAGGQGVFQVDCTKPWMDPVVEAEDQYTNVPPSFATFTFHDDVNLDWAVYQIDAAGWDTLFSAVDDTVWSAPGFTIPQVQFDALSEGSHTIDFLVTDDAGNDSLTTWGFIVDRLTPWMDAIVEPEEQYYNTPPTFAVFRFHDESDLERAEYRFDGSGGWTAIFADTSTTDWIGDGYVMPDFGLLSEGPHTVEFRVWDDAGNNSPTYGWRFIKDTAAPDPPTNFLALPGHKKVHLSWDNPVGDTTLAGVIIRRSGWGDYPEFGTAVPSYPANEAGGDSVKVVLAPMDSTTEAITLRDIYYYAAFSYDWAGNVAAYDDDAADRSTNYWLGDVDSLGFSEGVVNVLDLVVFSGAFGEADGGPGWVAECDFGPTDDWSRLGVPEPDDVIDFEDLMIFSMNYENVSPSLIGPALVVENTGELRERVSFRLESSYDGSETTVRVTMENEAKSLKGVRLVIDYGMTAELREVKAGELLSSRDFFGARPAQPGLVVVSIAALGTGRTIQGSGTVAQLIVRNGLEHPRVTLERIDLRNVYNEREQIEVQEGDTETQYIPTVTALLQNHPNPFNPVTTIPYDVATPGHITLRIYDVSGRLVRTLQDGHKGIGRYHVDWEGRNDAGTSVSTGIYFYRLTAPGFEPVTRKMMLLK